MAVKKDSHPKWSNYWGSRHFQTVDTQSTCKIERNQLVASVTVPIDGKGDMHRHRRGAILQQNLLRLCVAWLVAPADVHEIAAEYNLTLADAYAALAYYFDRRNEIDRGIDEGEAFAATLPAKTPSKLKQKLQGQM